MSTLSAKQENEQAAFNRFIERLGTRGEWLSVSSQKEPAPDLLCVHVKDGPIAFELVSLTDPVIAKIQAAGAKATQRAFSTSDPSERIVQKKLHRRYVTNAIRVELLIYTDGQIITTDDAIIPTILPWFDAVSHSFKRVWFMGNSKLVVFGTPANMQLNRDANTQPLIGRYAELIWLA